MKKIISFLITLIMIVSAVTVSYAKDTSVDLSAINMNSTRSIKDVFLRDPCVLAYDGYYYMYGTGAARGLGYGCYVSEDLENWAGPVNVFSAPAGFEGDKDFWAPECHYYNGSFYLFATYHSNVTDHRGVAIFKSDSPIGPFEQISDGSVTPKNYDAIDGTLYVDPDGQPWIAYVREWTATDDNVGRMTVAKLSNDLSKIISEPKDIFRADDPFKLVDNHVTDGPYLYTTSSGKLLMIWSGTDDGYNVKIAEATDGKIDGKWKQQPVKLYSKLKGDDTYANNGGHGMIFTDNDGRLLLSIHSPNSGDTRPVMLELVDTGDTLVLKDRYEKQQDFEKEINMVIESVANSHHKVIDFFKNIFEKVVEIIAKFFK